MSQQNQPQQLDATVQDLLERYDLNTFRRYWELLKRTAPLRDVQAFFFCVDPATGYCNVAVLSEGKVIDVEGDDSDGTGGASIRDLASIAAIHLRLGQLEGFSRTHGASVVAVTRLMGEAGSGPYWSAQTPAEEDRLLRFAQNLVSSLARTESYA